MIQYDWVYEVVYEMVYKWAAGFDNCLPVMAVKIQCVRGQMIGCDRLVV